MGWQFPPYIILSILSASISVAIAIYAWQRRQVPGSKPFALLMLAISVWAMGYAFGLMSTNLSTIHFWAKVEYIGVVFIPVFWLIFVIQYTNREQWLTRRNLILLCALPIMILLLIWTNEFHGLFYTETGLTTIDSFVYMTLTPGVVYWLNVLYTYVLFLIGVALLAHRAAHVSPPYRKQIGIIVGGMLIIFIANILYMFGVTPVPFLEIDIIVFTLTGLIIAWGLFKYKLLDIVPIAREKIVGYMSDGVIVFDAQNRVVDINPAAENMIGHPQAEVIGKSIEQILFDQSDLIDRFRDVSEVHTQIVVGEQTEQHYFDLRISPLYGGEDELAGRMVILHDITKIKQAELALRKQETQYRLLAENLDDVVWSMDHELNFTYISPSIFKLRGVTVEEAMQESVPQTMTPKSLDVVAKMAQRQVEADKKGDRDYISRFEIEQYRKDASTVWVECVTKAIYDDDGNNLGTLGVSRDIAQRKQMEMALRQNESQYRLLAENIADVVWVLDIDTMKFDYVSPSIEQMRGFTVTEAMAQSVEESLTPESMAYAQESLADRVPRFLAGDPAALHQLDEIEQPCKDGSIISVEVSTTLRHKPDGGVEVVGISRDATIRKQAETALRESEERFATVMNSMEAIMYVADMETYEILFTNAYTRNLFGEVVGKVCWQSLQTNQTGPCDFCTNKYLTEDGALSDDLPLSGNATGIYTWDFKNMLTDRWYSIQDQAIRWTDGRWARLEIATDVTEIKESEQSSQQHSRELALFNRLGQTFSSSLDIDQVLNVFLDEMSKLMDITIASFWLTNPDTGGLICRQAKGIGSEIVQGWHLEEGQGLAGQVAKSGKSLMVTDTRSTDIHFDEIDQEIGVELRSILSILLKVKGKVIGVLNLADSSMGRFNEQDLTLLEPLVASAAIAIENARLHDNLQTELTEHSQAQEALRKLNEELEDRVKARTQDLRAEIAERKRMEKNLIQNNEELITLNAITATITQSHNLNHILSKSLDLSLAIVGPAAGYVLLLDEGMKETSLAAQSGFPLDTIEAIKIVQSSPSPLEDFDLSSDALLDPLHKIIQQAGWHLLVDVPFKYKGEVWGIMQIFGRTPDELSLSRTRLFEAIGRQLGIAIENNHLTDQAAKVRVMQELDLLRSELIGNVSHELRTPLGLIKAATTTLLAQDITFDAETQALLLRGIDEESDRLNHIVNNLLDLSRLEQKRLILDQSVADIGPLIANIVETMQPQAKPGSQIIYKESDEALVANIDAKRIEQVIRNLLTNAIKYSPDGGTVVITGWQENGRVFVEVSDEGVGIPVTYVKKIFERFYRVENEVTRDISGVGLGLSISKEIVEAHNGQMWVESEEGRGSKFYFTLPTIVKKGDRV